MLRTVLLTMLSLLCSSMLHAQVVSSQNAQQNAAEREAAAQIKAEPADTATSDAEQNGKKKEGLRLLYLEPKFDAISPGDREILAGLLFDAMSGQERFLLITADDLRRRAPMEADRIDECREELCLYEFAESVSASYVLFSEARASEEGRIQLDIAMFQPADAEIRSRQTLRKDTVADFSGFVRPAVQGILSEALEDTRPKLLENQFFLGSFSVLTLGTMAGLASLGYVLELESALARPDVHRSEKERALEQGPTAIWVGVGSAAVALLGLASSGIAAYSHYASIEE